MSTTARIKATVNAHELLRLLSRVGPHMDPTNWRAIAGIRLEGDGKHLIAIATDRYTMAIARTKLRSDDGPWEVTIPGARTKSLRHWLKAHDRQANIHISPAEKTITFESTTDEIHLATEAGAFPKWRGMIATLLADNPQPVPLTAFTTEYLARWAAAECYLHASQAGPGKPLLFFGADFLGLQMPARVRDDLNREKAVSAWADTLDLAGVTPAEVPEPGPEGSAAAMIERLLYRVAVTTADAMELPYPSDPHLLATYAIASSNSWTAYRLLMELQELNPSRTAKILGKINADLDAGDFSETAWEYATEAGHDPQKWVEEHLAKRAALAEKAVPADAEPQPASA